jgi:DnaJ-class molecular chaperone
MTKRRTIQDILEFPPTKEVKCPKCDGSGIINRRGMISSDHCDKCKTVGYYGGRTGKIEFQDYKKTEKLIREIIEMEG